MEKRKQMKVFGSSKIILLSVALLLIFKGLSFAQAVYFFDDFENGLSEWTIGGRRAPGTTNIANTVFRYGSMMGHLYKHSFTEVNFSREFEYDPVLRFTFDMEVTASSQSAPSNYYGMAYAAFSFRDSEDNILGTVAYMKATSSYPFNIAAQNPTRSYNQVPAGVLEHYSLTMDELISQITIDANDINRFFMVFNCYSSTYPYPSVSAELWVDDITVTNIPEIAPPIADADGPYTIYTGDVLILDASGSTDDNNDIVSYMWDIDDDGTFETDAGDQAIFSVDFAYLESLGLLINNNYTIILQVTDSEEQSDVAESTLTILPPPVIEVPVDIKPTSCPNPLNVKSKGILPVAILGSEIVDVNEIDVASIRLAGVSPIRSSYEDVAAPLVDPNGCECSTEGPDGYTDLTLKFKTQEIVEVIGEVDHGDVLLLSLEGVLSDETQIEGSDCIVIRGKSKHSNRADSNKDGKVNGIDFSILAESWLQ